MRVSIQTILGPGWIAVALLACGPKGADDTGEIVLTSSDGGGTGVPATSDSPSTSATSTSPTATSPTSTSGDPVTTTHADTSGDGETFVVRGDAGVLGCDLAEQSCPAGQKCNPSGMGSGSVFNGTPICVPLAPDPKPHGSPCSVLGDELDGTDDCELGTVCLFPDDQGVGECHKLCGIFSDPDPGCAPGDQCAGLACQSCFWGFCDAPCDPLDSNTCDAGEVCLPNVDQWFCILDASGAEGQAGDSCEVANGCDPGLLCTNAAEIPGCDAPDGCCSPFCSTDKPNTCPNKAMGELCVPYYAEGQAPPQFVTLGLCSLPP
ncbi:hypothetical protein [Nannocystis sp.]|uniref:hypothetical protein n=1 Tax=Nannocystis sp. TaxID=1962667 RepID=UPI0024259E00|nr:hypothetical protein [Nannocystis sp.]MBK7828168.1 hypothetical protein [Nannocystis sp.]MBK9753607.1 hypothetical protein [Nannocystis sp.]